MGSVLEPLGPHFLSLWGHFGIILGALGTILGAFGGHFGSLGGPWVTFWNLGARQKAIYPQDRSASHTFGILSRQNGPKWLPKGSQNGPKMHQKSGQKKDAEKDQKKEAPESTRTSLGPQKPSKFIVKHSVW